MSFNKNRKVTDLFGASAVWSLQTLTPAALCCLGSKHLGAEEQAERRAPPGFLPLPRTLGKQRDLQGKDSNYKVLMIGIMCTQVWRCGPHQKASWSRGR